MEYENIFFYLQWHSNRLVICKHDFTPKKIQMFFEDGQNNKKNI